MIDLLILIFCFVVVLMGWLAAEIRQWRANRFEPRAYIRAEPVKHPKEEQA
jgi:hypothetical protein